MCGIVGFTGDHQAAPILLYGLSRLEYRGYDSAGLAVRDGEGNTAIIKAKGRLKVLADKTSDGESVPGTCGIGHTRWATHGEPSEINAHPHMSDDGNVVAVHNGIIENYQELKDKLLRKGYAFYSETDTEVAVKLIDYYYKKTESPLTAIATAMLHIRGSYAFGVMFKDCPNKIFAARKDSPLIIGKSEHGTLIGSDVPAILDQTRNVYYIDNMEIAELTKDEIHFFNMDEDEIEKEVVQIKWDAEAAEKGGYEHFMLKEIHEQPRAVQDTIGAYVKDNVVDFSEIGLKDEELANIERVYIVGCGSAYHVGIAAKYVMEDLTGLMVDVDFASEFRYRNPKLSQDTLVVIISQSGETADTLAALKLAKENGINTLAIVNRRDSSIAREADSVIYTEAGIEVAVATTKAYLAQVLILLLLAFKDNNKETKLLEDLKLLPNLITKYINEYDYSNIANILKDKEHIFYLGRGIDYYLSMEGSLKLKEISYIHSEAFQAGELKHGSISLIDKDFGVVSVVTDKTISDKTISNLKEVSARGAKIITITNIKDNNFADYTILVEDYDEILNPLLVIVPMQMLAYNVAKLRDCDIDKPRNLAKSVTVE